MTTTILIIFGWVSYGIIILASLLHIFEFIKKKFGNKKTTRASVVKKTEEGN